MNQCSVKNQQYEHGKNNYLPLVLLGIVIVVLDLILVDILPFANTSLEQLINDVMKISFSGYLGIKISNKLDIPIWWRKPHTDKILKYLEIFGLGLFIILLNTLATGGSGVYIRNLEGWAWFASVTPFTAILIAARAALTEEIFFRLFIIPLLALMVSVFITKKNSYLSIAIGISAIAFGFLHPGFTLALVFGIILGYLYSKYGLVPVLFIHFIADAIPFIYLSIS